MRLYIKGDYTKEIPFDYLELAKRMWFEEKDGIEPDLSYAGYLDLPIEKLSIHLKLNKWMHDNRWNNVRLKEGITNKFGSHEYENLELDFEDNPATDYREKGDCLRLITTHKDILTVDKRALYIMAIEVASAIGGHISEDDKETWLSIKEFKTKHADLLHLTYDEAADISLEEIKVMKAVDEPLWEELDRKREEYIRIHGEVELDDEEE